MRKSADERNPERRAAVLREAETIFMRDVPYIPVLFYSNKNLVSSRLEGWIPNLRGANATRFLSLKP
jgi:ABC-type transport system substrate-binding protein